MANRATLILLCMLSVIQLTFVAGFQAMHMPVYSTAGNVRVSMHTRPLLLRSNRLLPRRAPATHSCNRPNKPSGREWHLRVTPEPGDQPPATVTITADGLKTKKNMNAYRKIFHAINGVALALLYEFFMSQAQAVLAFGLSFMVLTAVEVLRLKYAENTVSKFLFRRFRSIARDYETEQLSGMVYYMAGITIAVALFPKVVAVLAILFLGLGDPFASTVGIKYGKLGPRFSNGKSLFGSLGGFAICMLTTALYFLRTLELSWTLAAVSLLGGVAAVIPETLCGRITDGKGGPIDVDDNLAVPIFSGLILYALLKACFPHLIA